MLQHFFEFTHNCMLLKNMLLVWESAYATQYFSVLYSDASTSSFFLMLYSHKSHLSESVLLSLFARSTLCFLQFTGIGVGSWYDFQFSLSRASNASCLARVSCFCRFYALSNFLVNLLISSSMSSDWMQAAFIDFFNFALSFLFSAFSLLNFSLSCVIFAHKLVFLSSRLKG